MAKQRITWAERQALWRCPAYRALRVARQKETIAATKAARAARVARYRAECAYRPAAQVVQP